MTLGSEIAKVLQLGGLANGGGFGDCREGSEMNALSVDVQVGHPATPVAGHPRDSARIVAVRPRSIPSIRARRAWPQVGLPVIERVAVDVVDSHGRVADLCDEPVEQGDASVCSARARSHVTLVMRPLDPKDQRNVLGVDDGRSAVQADFDLGGIAVYNNPRRSVADPTLTEATRG